MRLRNRITPADIFTDGRLLSVSPRARALAIVLEALAEDSGVVAANALEVLSSAGAYLIGEDGRPPSIAEIEAMLAELEAVTWILGYESDGMRLAYLRGFGARQQGPTVGLGMSKATGAVSPHLPVPPCVTLDTESAEAEKWMRANRVRVVHCERQHTACKTCPDRPGVRQPGSSYKPASSQEQQQELEARHEPEAEAEHEAQALHRDEEKAQTLCDDTIAMLDRVGLNGRWRSEAERMLEGFEAEQQSDIVFRAFSAWQKAGKSGSIISHIRKQTDLRKEHQ